MSSVIRRGPALARCCALLGVLACDPAPVPAPTPAAAPSVAPIRPPARAPHGGPPVSSRSDALAGPAGGWRAELAVPVPSVAPSPSCQDGDGDGFLPIGCGPPATADCDDGDAAVTPATERLVPAGPFLMGEEGGGAGVDESPVHVVVLGDYCLDVYEATAAQLAASTGAAVPGDPSLPGVGIDHATAAAHCAASGKILPTEAQWEKAARGGCELGTDPGACDRADLRRFPWGDAAPDCSRANHRAGQAPHIRACADGVMGPAALPAGAGPYGHLHLAGNAWEHVADRYHPRVYGSGALRTEPGGPAEGAAHVIRGGGHDTFSTNMRVANRFSTLVEGSAAGVRCARSWTAPVPDPVAPLSLVQISGTVRAATGTLDGAHLYVSAFARSDLDPSGRLPLPGRSPVAEAKQRPRGGASQPFSLDVPQGEDVLINVSLEAVAPGAGVPQSGSGGVGQADALVSTERDQGGVHVVIRPLSAMPGPR